LRFCGKMQRKREIKNSTEIIKNNDYIIISMSKKRVDCWSIVGLIVLIAGMIALYRTIFIRGVDITFVGHFFLISLVLGCGLVTFWRKMPILIHVLIATGYSHFGVGLLLIGYLLTRSYTFISLFVPMTIMIAGIIMMRSALHREPRLCHISMGLRTVASAILSNWKNAVVFGVLTILVIFGALLFEKILVVPYASVVFGITSGVMMFWVWHFNLVLLGNNNRKSFYNQPKSSTV